MLSAAREPERVARPRLGGVFVLSVAFDVMGLCPRNLSERPEHVAQAALTDHSPELLHGLAAVLKISHQSFLYGEGVALPISIQRGSAPLSLSRPCGFCYSATNFC